MEDASTGGGAGSPPAPAELIGRFLKTQESDHTRRAYRGDLTGFFEREGSPEEVREAGPKDVRAYLKAEAEELSTRTVGRRASTLSAFFRWLEEEGFIEENPLAEAPGPDALARQAKRRAEGKAVVPEGLDEGAEPVAEPDSGGDLGNGAGPEDASPRQESPDGEEPPGKSRGEEAAEAPAPEEPVPDEEAPDEGAPGQDATDEEGDRPPEWRGPRRTGPPREGGRRGRSGTSPLGDGWEPEEETAEDAEPEEATSEGESSPEEEAAPEEAVPEEDEPGEKEEAVDLDVPSGDPPGAGLPALDILSGLSAMGETPTEDASPEDAFPEDFLEVPRWARADLKVQIGSALRFTNEALGDGMEIPLRSVPSAIAQGLSLLADRERFPEGAIEAPYYALAGPSGEWMVTVWRTGEEALSGEGGVGEGKITLPGFTASTASGLAARLTFATPLMEAEKRMEEEGTFPSPSGEAARLLWLMQERGWVLTGPSYDLLEGAIGLSPSRKDPAEGQSPTKRFEAACTEEARKEAREAVALEVATLLAKGLGLPKSDKVKIERISW